MAQVSQLLGTGRQENHKVESCLTAEFKASLKIKKNLGMVAHIFHSNIHE